MFKPFLYFLTEEDGRSLTVVNDVVTSKGVPTPLTQSPDGWQEVAIAWERNLSRYGLVRAFSFPLGFIRDGARILRHVMYRQNIERKIYLLLKKLSVEVDDDTYNFIYRYFYKGELDFSTFKDEENRVSINIMEGGLSKLLKANEGTKYEIPCDEIWVKMNGVLLFEKQNFMVTISGGPGKHFVPISFISKEGRALGLATFSVSSRGYSTINQDTLDYFAAATVDIANANISGTISFTLGLSTTYRLDLFFYNTETGALRSVNILTKSGLTGFVDYSYDFSTDFNINDNEKIFLSAEGTVVAYKESNISLDFSSKANETFIKANRPLTTFKRLTQKITGNQDDADSGLLALNENLVVTSGDALRGFEDAKIKTTMNDFFESYNVMLNCGLGIEDKKIIIENKEHFFDNSDPIHLGKAKDLKVMPAVDIMANTVKIGYPDKAIDEVNGRYEFNNTHVYTSPITRIQKEFTLVSKYLTGCYNIEQTRINFDGRTSTDSDNDNEVFVLNIDPTPQIDLVLGTYYNLKRVAYDSTEGIVTDTVFNIEQLTPKRLIRTHGNWLRSMFYGFDDKYFKFQTTEKNADVKTVKGSDIVDEDADQQIGKLTAPLFKPFYFEFETEVPVDLVDIMEANTNRCFSFEWDGAIYKGFAIKAGIAASTKKEQAFKLLCTSDTDIKPLING